MTIFRQAAASRIITTAHDVDRGTLPDLMPPADASDFYFVKSADGEDAAAKIVKVVAERIPARFQLDPVRQVQVLCPMNRGSAGARALIVALQAALHPPRQDAPAVERFGFIYRIGDKIMQIENNYDRDVFNGDLGFIAAIDMRRPNCSTTSMAAPSPIHSANSTRSRLPSPPPSTNRRAPNILPWSSRY